MLAQEEIKWEFGLDWLNKKVSLVPCHRSLPSTCQDYFVVLLTCFTYYTLSCLKSSQTVPFYHGGFDRKTTGLLDNWTFGQLHLTAGLLENWSPCQLAFWTAGLVTSCLEDQLSKRPAV